jgi:Holliday junction resolvase
MSRKSKGISAERELIHKFWNSGWAAFRCAASGATKYPMPDVIAGNNVRKLAIEVKSTKNPSKYFDKKEIRELEEFAVRFGAEPWVGIKFLRRGWKFLTLEDLKETEKNFAADKQSLELKGLSFEELIKY